MTKLTKSAKRIISLLVSAALLLALAGCGYNTRYIMTVDGKNVAAGVYIMNQFAASRQAQQMFAETYSDVIESGEEYDYDDYTLEGIKFFDWVNQKALELTAKMFVVEKMFDEQGLSFTADEAERINVGVSNSWDTDWYLEELYSMFGEQAFEFGGGGETWGQFFSAAGVSKESFALFHISDVKMSMVFDSIYGEEGTNPVSEEEWRSVFGQDYIRYRALPMSTVDLEGEPLDEDKLSELRAFGEQLADSIAQGESFFQSKIELEAFMDELLHDHDHDDDDDDDDDHDDDDDNDDDHDDDDDDDDEDDDDNDDDDDDNDEDEDEELDLDDFNLFEQFDREQFDEYLKVSDYTDNEIVDFIAGLELGIPEIYQGESADFIFVRLDVFENEGGFDTYRDIVVAEIKGDEFENMLDERAAELMNTSIVVNESARDKYDPRRFIGMGM